MRYKPNPAHKRETTEAGPPRWRPGKALCPSSMTAAARNELLQSSVPENRDNPASTRFAVRRGSSGLEFFVARATLIARNGEVEYHGYPAKCVPGNVLKLFFERGDINKAEYRKHLKRLS